jgi:hypothetical protein
VGKLAGFQLELQKRSEIKGYSQQCPEFKSESISICSSQSSFSFHYLQNQDNSQLLQREAAQITMKTIVTLLTNTFAN